MLSVGDRLPDGTFKVKSEDGSVAEITVEDEFGGRKVVLIGLPGAFTSTCHNAHIPPFVDRFQELRDSGAERIVVLSVNDHHVMRAWAESLGAVGKLDFLADPVGTFTRAIGMEKDMTVGGLGPRCQRFSALIEDRVVKTLNFEPEGGRGISATGATVMLEQI